MNPSLTDRFETTDGSTPHAAGITNEHSASNRIAAFNILRGGDVFDTESGSQQRPDKESVTNWVRSHIVFKTNGVPKEICQRIAQDMIAQLGFNKNLVRRLQHSKLIQIDLIPPNQPMGKFGFPKQISPHISGFFWNHPSWAKARIAFRAELIGQDPALVVHEMAHAIHYLAFTQEERSLIYDFLRPAFGHRQAMDEVFAIYSEREFIQEFSPEEKEVQGIYGFTRTQWSENHVFTRFIRKLYFPTKPLAGPRLTRERPPAPTGLKLPTP